MTLNNSRQGIIDFRRREVARLRLMGLSQREIVDALEKADITNPETGKPFALGTINSDIKELQTEWRREAMEDTRTQRGRVLAEIRLVRSKGWEKESLAMVQRGLDQETTILGLQRPPAPEDIIHYDTRYVEKESDLSKHVGKLITAGNRAGATPEEKATLWQKYKDWFDYASMLLDRCGELLEPLVDPDDPEPQADDNDQDNDNTESEAAD